MSPPGDEKAARRASHSRLRASHADRDQAVDTLKDAFVQGRLTKDEFDARVSHALTSLTHADLASLTADLPAVPPSRPDVSARTSVPARPPSQTIRHGTRVIAVTTLITAAADAFLTASPALIAVVWTLTMIWFGVVLLNVSVMLDSRYQRRSGRQLPPGSGRARPGLSPP
jgi:hypothetical protein